MTIGELMKQKRLEKDLSLSDVGKAVGVDRATVSRWEHGIINIDRQHISSICRILNIDPVIFCHPNEVIFPEERQLIEAYRNAGEETRENIRSILKLPELKKDSGNAAI